MARPRPSAMASVTMGVVRAAAVVAHVLVNCAVLTVDAHAGDAHAGVLVVAFAPQATCSHR